MKLGIATFAGLAAAFLTAATIPPAQASVEETLAHQVPAVTQQQSDYRQALLELAAVQPAAEIESIVASADPAELLVNSHTGEVLSAIKVEGETVPLSLMLIAPWLFKG